jgi:hypothetical protein
MSQQVIDFLDNNPVEIPLGGIDEIEASWVERQEALERAGYMLRPRYRPGWKPSWDGTNKLYFSCEDGQDRAVRIHPFSRLLTVYEFSYVWAWTQPGSPTEDLSC